MKLRESVNEFFSCALAENVVSRTRRVGKAGARGATREMQRLAKPLFIEVARR
jgi:hypothetical protein